MASSNGQRRGVATVARRSARVVYRRVRRTPLGAVATWPAVERARARLFAMPSTRVVEVVHALADASVPSWVGGGWGVDALLGRQTRWHKDLDVFVDVANGGIERAAVVLARLGFAIDEDAGEPAPLLARRIVVRDRGGRTVDLIGCTRAGVAPRNGVPDLAAEDIGIGRLAGVAVACLSAQSQLRLHQSYLPTAKDRRDVNELCAAFRLERPPGYDDEGS